MDPAEAQAVLETLNVEARSPVLHILPPPTRYPDGHILSVRLTGVVPAAKAQVTLRLERFLGGGFAGQVYRARVTAFDDGGAAAACGLRGGQLVAVKILVPPSGFSRGFRDLLYGLAFQGPFAARAHEAAIRAGLLWQKLVRRAAAERFGSECVVKDVYGTFYDSTLKAFAEVTEWVEGRVWRLETDARLWRRWRWRTTDLSEVGSVEYVTVHRFMVGLVALLHDMGAPELARQYEWWTLKSQPNVLIRTTEDGLGGSHPRVCAVDFRAGLALLPCLPMSPADLWLIPIGLLSRGAVVQFDHADPARLEAFVAARADAFADLAPALAELRERERTYRRSRPDVTRQGWRLLTDPTLRRDVRAGLLESYRNIGLLDREGMACLGRRGVLFAIFYAAGVLPLIGTCCRRLIGMRSYRRHVAAMLTSWAYLCTACRAARARVLSRWLRHGRIGPGWAHAMMAHPCLYVAQRVSVGLLPWPALHRAVVTPGWVWARVRAGLSFVRRFWVDPAVREQWFLDELGAGLRDGSLHRDDYERIAAQARDPFIVKYLKCVAVHFATLPVTQIVSLTIAAAVAGWAMASGRGWELATAWFAGVLAAFQLTPISPGSICRGAYVLYLMIRERNLRDYLVACPVSFVKYLGYLAFPLQMTATYPRLARFLAGRWATRAVHCVPVFGEHGALLEHWVFDVVFNVPQALAVLVQPRLRLLLNLWAVAGTIGMGALVWLGRESFPTGLMLNLGLLWGCIFLLPRLLFSTFRNRAASVGHAGSEAS